MYLPLLQLFGRSYLYYNYVQHIFHFHSCLADSPSTLCTTRLPLPQLFGRFPLHTMYNTSSTSTTVWQVPPPHYVQHVFHFHSCLAGFPSTLCTTRRPLPQLFGRFPPHTMYNTSSTSIAVRQVPPPHYVQHVFHFHSCLADSPSTLCTTRLPLPQLFGRFPLHTMHNTSSTSTAVWQVPPPHYAQHVFHFHSCLAGSSTTPPHPHSVRSNCYCTCPSLKWLYGSSPSALPAVSPVPVR